MATAALIKGIVSRFLPTPFTDDREDDKPVRISRYGEQVVQTLYGPTRHALAEEGSYFVATNATPGTGLAYSITAAFSDTTPWLYVFNNESPSNQNAKSIFLDYAKIIVTVAPATTTQCHMAVILDGVSRNLSTDNTTAITPTGPNGATGIVAASGAPLIKAQNSATASVIVASSQNKRIVTRCALGGLPIVGDELVVLFGSTDAGASRTTAAAGRQSSHGPPVIIPPGWSATFHLWFVGNATTGLSYELELGAWFR